MGGKHHNNLEVEAGILKVHKATKGRKSAGKAEYFLLVGKTLSGVTGTYTTKEGALDDDEIMRGGMRRAECRSLASTATSVVPQEKL